ncbi:Endonuclease/exonuclease/phosphatase, partial [Thelephora terrestris]
MNGRGGNPLDKWGSINNLMKKRRIAILSLQETHPSDEMQKTIEKSFRNTLRILHSADPDNPGRKGGVSIVIHKSLLDAKNATHQVVIPGRVNIVEIPWNESDKLQIMNVYAPVKNEEKADFWKGLKEAIDNDENLHPDVVLGDLNLVENPEIDRLNNRGGSDPEAARIELSELTTELDLTDGWRRRNPRKRGYTFTGNGQSRLDRIYVKEELYQWCTDWKIEHPGFRTDHNMVSVQITSENMPYIGKGRWALPAYLLKNSHIKKRIQERAKHLQTVVERTSLIGDRANNPQTALKTFKMEIIDIAREYQRTHQPRLENTIRSLQKELE